MRAARFTQRCCVNFDFIGARYGFAAQQRCVAAFYEMPSAEVRTVPGDVEFSENDGGFLMLLCSVPSSCCHHIVRRHVPARIEFCRHCCPQ